MKMIEFNDLFKFLYQKQGHGNYFTYYRSVWLVVLSASAILIFVLTGKFRRNFSLPYLAVFGFLTFLSAFFSAHRGMSIWGDPERFEGVFVWLGYLAITLIFSQFSENAKRIKLFLVCLILSSSIIAIVGALQFFGYDYFYDGIAQKYLSANEDGFVSKLLPKSSDAIISLFGNSNYTGSYLAIAVPLTFVFTVLSRRLLFFWLIIHSLLYLNLLVCFSRSAFYAAFAAILFSLVFLGKRVFEEKRSLIILLVIYSVFPFFIDAYSMKHGKERFFSGGIFGREIVTSFNPYGNFEDLKITGSSVKTVFDGIELNVEAKNGELFFYDKDGKIISYKWLTPDKEKQIEQETGLNFGGIGGVDNAGVEKKLLLNRKVADRIMLNPEQIRGFEVFAWPEDLVVQIGRGKNFFLVRNTSQGFKIVNHAGAIDEIREIETIGFKGYENFASSRGYIWSRTLPLLKKSIFLGYGPDTFSGHFPNYDYLGKLRFLSSGIFRIIDKPHSFYFQIAFGSGIVALVVFILFLIKYFIETAKSVKGSDFFRFEEAVALAVMSSIVGFLLVSIFNDSVVSVSPVFWSLLGIGIATNDLILKNKVMDVEQIGC
ncbi:MAG: O-antigen ligase family protein [Candidatus Rifleibacteriota bacterium]